ncbi:MAG: DUF3883 domain-containing protein [Bacteroides sp.]|nr:DUF3883 domain-containing protein [Bacteroides sp.]
MSNMFFFFFNPEKRIGFKKLTLADLGLSTTSNQTHIGLYGEVLTFLDDSDVVKSAMLIYDNYCDILSCLFDRIKNPDGTYRSPKIRMGDNHTETIVSKIREFAKQKPHLEWFLIWTGLDSEELVFWLLNNESKEYSEIRHLLPKYDVVYKEDSKELSDALNFIIRKVNFVSTEIQKDLEIVSQIESPSKPYKPKDIEKAEIRFKETGKKGEELIAEYLEKEKSAGRISCFDWVNRSSESGLPYDFYVNNQLYIDVKSTMYNFEQLLFFSNQEIDFLVGRKDLEYSVFRVFDLNKEQTKLRICNKCLTYMTAMQKNILDFQTKVKNQDAVLQNIKLGVKPTNCFLEMQPTIEL